MNTPPRFTEDEIAQMNREAIQIYHAENLRLAAQLDELKQASKAVINELRIEQLGPGYIHIWGAKGIYHEFTQQAAYDILHHFLHLVYKKD